MIKKYIIPILIIISLILSACGTNSKTYEKDLLDTKQKIITVAEESEEMLNLYARMWAIRIEGKLVNHEFVEKETGVSKYDLESYFEFKDGNIGGEPQSIISGLQNLYQDQGQIDELDEALTDIKKQIKKLNKPPKDYEDVFDKIFEMYSLTEEIADLAASPSGSLISFNEQRGELSNDIVKLNKEIDVLLPE